MWQALALAGVILAGAAAPVEKKPDVAVGKDVAFVKEWSGAVSGQEKAKEVVVKDQKAWEETWAAMNGKISPKPELPKIDFDRQMVVGVFLGTRNTGGFSVKITGIESGDKLAVKAREYGPPLKLVPTAGLTAPYHVVVVPKSDKTVEFVVEKAPPPDFGKSK
jgi:hypothetical protein